MRTAEQKSKHAAEERARYYSNREDRLEKAKLRSPALRKAESTKRWAKQVARRRKFDLLKLDRPCYDCGGVFPPEAMDWDHKPGAEKSFGVSEALGAKAKPFDAVVDEIAKCDLVCACCHRIRTANRRP